MKRSLFKFGRIGEQLTVVGSCKKTAVGCDQFVPTVVIIVKLFFKINGDQQNSCDFDKKIGQPVVIICTAICDNDAQLICKHFKHKNFLTK